MSMLRLVVNFILLSLAAGGILILFVVYLPAQEHQKQAESFWGVLYAPDKSGSSLRWGMALNFVMPEGGPLLSTLYATPCSETPLPMVPVRPGPHDTLEVLCGFGQDAHARTLYLEEEGEAELRDTLFRVLRGEHVE